MQTSRDHPRFSLTAFFCIYFAYFICRIKFSDFLFLYSDECLNFQSCTTYIIYSSSPRYKTFRFIFLLSLSGTKKAFFKSSNASYSSFKLQSTGSCVQGSCESISRENRSPVPIVRETVGRELEDKGRGL